MMLKRKKKRIEHFIKIPKKKVYIFGIDSKEFLAKLAFEVFEGEKYKSHQHTISVMTDGSIYYEV